MIKYSSFTAQEKKKVDQCVDLILESVEEMFGENENYQDILRELGKRLNDKSKFENMYEEEKENVARTEAFKYLREQFLNSLDDFDFK